MSMEQACAEARGAGRAVLRPDGPAGGSWRWNCIISRWKTPTGGLLEAACGALPLSDEALGLNELARRQSHAGNAARARSTR